MRIPSLDNHLIKNKTNKKAIPQLVLEKKQPKQSTAIEFTAASQYKS
jgi:hypothetical protein